MRRDRLDCTRHLWVAIAFVAFVSAATLVSVSSAFAQGGVPTGVLTADTPVYILPDATRTPLTVLPAGTSVRVLVKEGDWYRVEFPDTNFGDRTGYIAVNNIQVQELAKPVQPPPPPPPASASARAAAARRRGPTADHGSLSLNVGLQTTSRAFESSSTFTQYAETGTLKSSYTGGRPLVFDVAASAGIWGALGFGIGVSHTSKPLGDEVSAGVPHPFFFNSLRTVTGTAPDLTRQEVAVHLDAQLTLSGGGSTRVAVFGGPSHFDVTQALVTAVVVSDEYPFDTATFVSATTTNVKQSAWGFNAGVDIAHRVSRYFSVGVLGRYSKATLQLSLDPVQKTEVEAGGFQLGGGVRILF